MEAVLVAALVACAVFAHRAARSTPGPAPRAHGVLVALDTVAVLLVVLAAGAPARFEALAQEDGPMEWATVVAWSLAAGCLIASVVGAPRAPRWSHAASLALAAFCAFCAGEEISWGQRLLAFQPPAAFLELNYQQELNVHNLLMDERFIGFKLQSKHLVAAIALGYGVLLPLVARKLRGTQSVDAVAVAFPPLFLAPWFIVVALVELAYVVELTGEAAELLLALLFCAAAALRLPWPKAAPIALVASVVFGAVAAALVDAVLFGDDDARIAEAQAEVQLLAADLQQPGAATPKLWTKKSVHRRLYTATRAGYLEWPADARFLEGRPTPVDGAANARVDRKGYLLDPWHNPYWLYFEKKSGRATVYSFGANRARDTAVKKTGTAAGDDVIVTWTILRPSASPDVGAKKDVDDEP